MNTTPATNDATRDTTDTILSRQGVALSVAAQALGVSLRTVQRRLDRGELGFIERDGKRFVLLPERSASGESGADGHDKARDSDATRDTFVVSRDTTARQIDASRDKNAGLSPQAERWSSEREREMRDEIQFLRGLIEGHQRSEAELRAALRKALEIAPRQLMQGDAPRTGGTPEVAPDVRPASESNGGEVNGNNDDDELDEAGLLAMCRRICQR